MSTAIELPGLSETQRQIVELAREFARTKIEPFAAEWDRRAHFARDVIDELGRLGVLGVGGPEAGGGRGAGRCWRARRAGSARLLCPPTPPVIVRGSRRIRWASGPRTPSRSRSRTCGSRPTTS